MPLNGSGAYTPPSPQFPAIPNTLILASDYNAVLNDVAAALSQAVFRDGQGAFTGNQSMGGFKLTNMAVGTADTDAVRKSQLLALFPIGAIYLTAGNTNPGTFLGGTWVQIAQGRTLIGVGTLGSDTYAAGVTGGAAWVTLTTTEMPWHAHGGSTGVESHDHSHTGISSESGWHAHTTPLNDGGHFSYAGGGGTTGINAPQGADGTTSGAGSHTHTVQTYGVSANHTHGLYPEGGSGPHENRMPFLAVYFWQRTA